MDALGQSIEEKKTIIFFFFVHWKDSITRVDDNYY